MLLKKEGLPEELAIVLCTVQNVQSHCVFVRLDEYDLPGMIHISEISPGRIRNIRDFVKEGKVVICKILKVNRERGQIDLSLRRVTEAQRRLKADGIKQEQKSEKILEFVAKKLGKGTDEIYNEVSVPILKEYDSLFAAFVDVVEGRADLVKLGISDKVASELTQAILQRMKPAEVEMKRVLHLTSHAPDGIDKIKSVLADLKKAHDGMEIRYEAGGRYTLKLTAPDYKAGEKVFEALAKVAAKAISAADAEGELIEEKK